MNNNNLRKIILDGKKCTGCGACYNACPKEAIAMVRDGEGFSYPQIIGSKCVDCNICSLVCPLNAQEKGNKKISLCAMYNKNEEIRSQSSSGGLFSALAEYAISKKGVVVGAAFESGFKVSHIIVSSREDLEKLRGSKYVQSDINNVFSEIKSLLDSNVTVLFSGAPCQVAGLKSFLKKDYENLYTVDFICHGVPSPAVWEKHIIETECKAQKKLSSVSFRDKRNGWKGFEMLYRLDDKSEIGIPHHLDPYFAGFNNNLYLRPSCNNCYFKQDNYLSDITMADLWGANMQESITDDDKGLSLVIVRSEKGLLLKEKAANDMEVLDIDSDLAIKYNPALNISSVSHIGRKRFFKYFSKMSVEQAVKTSMELTYYQRFLLKIRRILNER